MTENRNGAKDRNRIGTKDILNRIKSNKRLEVWRDYVKNSEVRHVTNDVQEKTERDEVLRGIIKITGKQVLRHQQLSSDKLGKTLMKSRGTFTKRHGKPIEFWRIRQESNYTYLQEKLLETFNDYRHVSFIRCLQDETLLIRLLLIH